MTIAGVNNYGFKKSAEIQDSEKAEKEISVSDTQQNSQDIENSVERSPMADLLMNYEVSDYSFSQNTSQMVFNSKNGEIRLQSTSVLNVSSHTEQINLEISLSAEDLNIDPSIFRENGNRPIQLELSFSYTQQKIEHLSYFSKQKSNRTPQEVVSDLAKALFSVVKQRGNKTVGLSLDIEALQALLGNEKTSALLEEIAALIALINSLRSMDQESKHYQIFVSGKGPTNFNSYQSTNVSYESKNINLKINIQPPKNVNPGAEIPSEG